VQFDTSIDSPSWRVTLVLLLQISSATWSKISQDITLIRLRTVWFDKSVLINFFCSLFDSIHGVRLDNSLRNCMRFLFFCYCKSNATGCFQSARVFRNEPWYRQSSYSTKLSAVGLQRYVVVMSCVGWSEATLQIDGFIKTLPGTLEQKMHWGFTTSSIMVESTQRPRMALDKFSSST